MKDFFGKINDKVRSAMEGRYGTDDFSKCILTVTLVFLVLAFLTGNAVCYLIAIAGIIYTYYRILSKDFTRRAQENQKFLSETARIRRAFRIQKKRFADRKEYRYFKCPNCGQEVRVPRGKGHIRITCPSCRNQFDRTV